jgi:glycerol-3-phosphate cytidylyltransferase
MLLTMGTFDVPHIGHALFLRRCEALSDEIVVGVNCDEYAARYKGRRPLFTLAERRALIAALDYRCMTKHGPGRDLITALRPNVVAIGSDWQARDYLAHLGMTRDELDSLGVQLVFLPYTAGISSSEIRRRL